MVFFQEKSSISFFINEFGYSIALKNIVPEISELSSILFNTSSLSFSEIPLQTLSNNTKEFIPSTSSSSILFKYHRICFSDISSASIFELTFLMEAISDLFSSNLNPSAKNCEYSFILEIS